MGTHLFGSPCMMSLTKKTYPTTKKIFECNLLDWPIRLSPWTAL